MTADPKTVVAGFWDLGTLMAAAPPGRQDTPAPGDLV
jgi:hypothetical protein